MTEVALTPGDRDRLVKLLGMLSSSYDGEVVNAGRLANSMLKAAGTTWNDVIASPRLPAPARPERECRRPDREWRRPVSISHSVRVCLSWPELLTPWELNYLRSINGKTSLTERQRRTLDNIVDKVEAFVIRWKPE